MSIFIQADKVVDGFTAIAQSLQDMQTQLLSQGKLLAAAYGVASALLSAANAALSWIGTDPCDLQAIAAAPLRRGLLMVIDTLTIAGKEHRYSTDIVSPSAAASSRSRVQFRLAVEGKRLKELCNAVLKVCQQ